MQRDILMAKQLRADGIVLGILDCDGRVDNARTKQLLDFAAPLPVTFHRAFDMSRDLTEALRDLQSIGIARVLTSGGKQTAMEGAATLATLVDAAAGSIAIIAGSGINAGNIFDLLQLAGVNEIHATLRSSIESPIRYRNESVAMGSEKGSEYERLVVRHETVKALLKAASQARKGPAKA